MLTTRLAGAAILARNGFAAGSMGAGPGAAVPVITPAAPGGKAAQSPAACPHAASGQGSASFLARFLARPVPAAPRHGVEFQAVSDEFVAKFAGDEFLQFLDLLVRELDDAFALHIAQVIVVSARHLLVAIALVSEIVPP